MSEPYSDDRCRVCNKGIRLGGGFFRRHPRYACCDGWDCGCYGATLPDDVCSAACLENEAFEDREDDGPLDLEDQLDRALDKAFPPPTPGDSDV